MGTYAIIVSWHHKLDKIENNKHRIITRCFYATLLTVSCSSSQSHLISNKSSQQMIPCLLVTKETLILLTWTQYNGHHLIYLADLYFYISLSEHFISDNLRHEIFYRNLCAQMPHCDSLIFSIACVELMDLAQELDNHRNGYKYLCWRFFLQGRNESCLFR